MSGDGGRRRGFRSRHRAAARCVSMLGVSQSRDPDDFLGWAPDIGFWDAPQEPTAPTPPPSPRAVLVPPLPPLPQKLPPRRSSPAPSSPPIGRPSPETGRRPAPQLVMPLAIAFAVMLVITLWTALMMVLEGTQSSPVPLLVCVGATVLLGRRAWVLGRR